MNKITETLMRIVSEYDGDLKGAYNIREDGGCAARQSTENIRICIRTSLKCCRMQKT